ncbi:SET domain-containing protein [Xylariomycetidae sp. FL0641]|nr:SET domain-containing protein [Xylariomycetidae sp. FL0641]
MADPAFDSTSAAFLQWFLKWPGATFHPNIKIADLRTQGAGRGIVATADIPEETTLFTIPRSAIISTQTSGLASKIPDIFATTGLEDVDNEADEDGSETSGPPDNWVSLILVLVYEYLQGDRSPWKPYFDVLPSRFDTPMWWSAPELEQLQASSVLARIGKEDADSMFRAKVLPAIEQHAAIFYPAGAEKLGEDELLLLAHRMGSVIMAYAFDLEPDEDEANADNDEEWVEDKEGNVLMGMVPMADILNADAEFNAHVNHGEESLTVTTLRPIRAGEEVLNYYGPLGNGELLRRYGYVTEKHARHDVVEIPWNLVLSVLKETLRLDEATWGKALNELDPEEIEDAFVLERETPEPTSTGEIPGPSVFAQLPPDLREQTFLVLKAIRKASPATVPDKGKRDEVFLGATRRALELRLAEYRTSAEQDAELLSAPGNPSISSRERMAVVVRRGEKVLLREAIAFTQAAMEKLKQQPDGDQNQQQQQPSAKRQRVR